MGSALAPLLFPHPERDLSAAALRSHPDLVWLQTRTGGRTPGLLVRCSDAPVCDLILLYIHGNAEDLGQLVESGMLCQMANACGASVFAVEYPGYSISEASAPSEGLCYESVEAALEYLTGAHGLGLPTEKIVPFGRSLGSGSAVHLAFHHPKIRGMVLQSPLESGARAVLNKTVSYFGYLFDPFQNYRKIGQVEAQTCIVHGTMDEVVPCHNGQALYGKLEQRGKAATPLWIPGRGHNDLPPDKVYRHVRTFLSAL